MKRYGEIYKEIFKLGLPLVVGQLGIILTAFADTMMVGHYSTRALASASFVNNLFNTPMFTVMGFTYGLTPLVGALFARGDEARIGRMLKSALSVNIIVSLAVIAVMTAVYFNLDKLGQPEELLPVIRPYYRLYLMGLVPVALFGVFSQWSYAIRRTVMPTVILVSCNLLNVIGNYALIYGHWGMPEMGLTGAGVSTLVARWLASAAIMCVFFFERCNVGYRRGFAVGSWWGRSMVRRVSATSWPVCMQMTFESGSFTVAAVMAGWVGAIGLASFQVIIITGMLGFMVYYSFGTAVSILVSNSAGVGDVAGMRRYAWGGYHILLAITTVVCLVFVFGARYILTLFTDDPQVYAAALALVMPLVLYQYGDATQINFANALRGTSKVMPMLWIAFVSYVAVGIPATYFMGFVLGMGVSGIVYSFSVSLFMAGGLFLYFFLRSTRRDAAPRV